MRERERESVCAVMVLDGEAYFKTIIVIAIVFLRHLQHWLREAKKKDGG